MTRVLQLSVSPEARSMQERKTKNKSFLGVFSQAVLEIAVKNTHDVVVLIMVGVGRSESKNFSKGDSLAH
jgi:hypothetical protein